MPHLCARRTHADETGSTQVGSLEDTRKALDFAKRGLLKQICTIYPIDKLPQAVADLRAGKIAGRAVVDFNA